MTPALLIGGAVVLGVAVYLLAAWAQRRGWVNFRATGSGMTAGIAEAGRVLDPPTKHVVTVRDERPKLREDGNGGSGGP